MKYTTTHNITKTKVNSYNEKIVNLWKDISILNLYAIVQSNSWQNYIEKKKEQIDEIVGDFSAFSASER